MVNDIIVLRDKDLLLLFYMISVVDTIVKEYDTAFKLSTNTTALIIFFCKRQLPA